MLVKMQDCNGDRQLLLSTLIIGLYSSLLLVTYGTNVTQNKKQLKGGLPCSYMPSYTAVAAYVDVGRDS